MGGRCRPNCLLIDGTTSAGLHSFLLISLSLCSGLSSFLFFSLLFLPSLLLPPTSPPTSPPSCFLNVLALPHCFSLFHYLLKAHDYSLDVGVKLIQFLEAQPECIPVGDSADVLSCALVHVLASARPAYDKAQVAYCQVRELTYA